MNCGTDSNVAFEPKLCAQPAELQESKTTVYVVKGCRFVTVRNSSLLLTIMTIPAGRMVRLYCCMIPFGVLGAVQVTKMLSADRGLTIGGASPVGGASSVRVRALGLREQPPFVQAWITYV